MSSGIVGGCLLADLGNYVAEIRFQSASVVSITVLDGRALAGPGHQETVAATTAEVRPGVYFTTCHVQSGGTLTFRWPTSKMACSGPWPSCVSAHDRNFRRLRDEQNGLFRVISGGSHQGF
jgi:hypothetical protein